MMEINIQQLLKKVGDMVMAGKTNDEIQEYLLNKYGEDNLIELAPIFGIKAGDK